MTTAAKTFCASVTANKPWRTCDGRSGRRHGNQHGVAQQEDGEAALRALGLHAGMSGSVFGSRIESAGPEAQKHSLTFGSRGARVGSR